MKKIVSILLVALLFAFTMVSCTPAQPSEPAQPSPNESGSTPPSSNQPVGSTEPAPSGDGIKIGIAINDLQLERWQRDWSYMEAACQAAGIDYISQSANGDEQTQMTQVESMLTQGIDALIIIAVSTESMAQAVELAHESNVPVICYDRLISNADVDYYVTFDMIGVGREQAKFLVEKVPMGKYFLLEGDKTDNNAYLFHQGQMEVLQPLIDKGDIEIVAEQWTDEWLEENAMTLTENVLTAQNNELDAILAANDSTAAGAIKALEEQGLAGSIPITGQDCDLAACKRIVAGTQTMSIYKRLENLANAAVDLAIKVAKGEAIETNDIYNNGQKDVPTLALELLVATKDTMMEYVIADGFQNYDDVYADIPEDQRPPRQ